jgi:hypothetical protein
MGTKTAVGEEGSGQTKPVGFWEAFWFWVKLGFINFGGLRARSPSCTASWSRRSGGSPRGSI